jgi:hypothetical protein
MILVTCFLFFFCIFTIMSFIKSANKIKGQFGVARPAPRRAYVAAAESAATPVAAKLRRAVAA